MDYSMKKIVDAFMAIYDAAERITGRQETDDDSEYGHPIPVLPATSTTQDAETIRTAAQAAIEHFEAVKLFPASPTNELRARQSSPRFRVSEVSDEDADSGALERYSAWRDAHAIERYVGTILGAPTRRHSTRPYGDWYIDARVEAGLVEYIGLLALGAAVRLCAIPDEGPEAGGMPRTDSGPVGERDVPDALRAIAKRDVPDALRAIAKRLA